LQPLRADQPSGAEPAAVRSRSAPPGGVPPARHALATSAGSATVLGPPDPAQPGPVVVDGGALAVAQPDRERMGADDVVGDVAGVAGRPPRPGDPERPRGIDAPRQVSDLAGD